MNENKQKETKLQSSSFKLDTLFQSNGYIQGHVWFLHQTDKFKFTIDPKDTFEYFKLKFADKRIFIRGGGAVILLERKLIENDWN